MPGPDANARGDTSKRVPGIRYLAQVSQPLKERAAKKNLCIVGLCVGQGGAVCGRAFRARHGSPGLCRGGGLRGSLRRHQNNLNSAGLLRALRESETKISLCHLPPPLEWAIDVRHNPVVRGLGILADLKMHVFSQPAINDGVDAATRRERTPRLVVITPRRLARDAISECRRTLTSTRAGRVVECEKNLEPSEHRKRPGATHRRQWPARAARVHTSTPLIAQRSEPRGMCAQQRLFTTLRSALSW